MLDRNALRAFTNLRFISIVLYLLILCTVCSSIASLRTVRALHVARISREVQSVGKLLLLLLLRPRFLEKLLHFGEIFYSFKESLSHYNSKLQRLKN